MAFTHYLITRFNIPASGWKYDKNHTIVHDDIWLQKRINLFETYTFPSITNQSNKNFIWLVYFDVNSPQYLIDKIEEWKKNCENFTPCYSSDYDIWLSTEMPNDVYSMTKDKDFVITTRIDNDDAFHEEAIKTIQESFVPQDNIIIDIEKGFCYDPQAKVITKYSIKSNPFISYIERLEQNNVYTVYKEGHPAWLGKAQFISITNNRLWFQVIHDTNISNAIHGKICLKPRNILRFHIAAISFLSTKEIIKKRIRQEYFLLKHRIKMFVKADKI